MKKSRKSRKNKKLDDSSRYALANNESSRNLDDSARQDGSVLFISAFNGPKDRKVIDKKKKLKDIDEDDVPMDSSDVSSRRQKNKKNKTKGINAHKKKKSLDETDSVSDSDEDKRKNTNKFSSGKIVKQSSSDIDS